MRLSDWIRRFEDICLRCWHSVRQIEAAERCTPGSTEKRNRQLRAQGVRIGEGCIIHTSEFSTEPYLVEIGNQVVIGEGTQFLAHEGAIHLIRDIRPSAQLFGRIVVGDESLIGRNCTIHPGTVIGRRCVIGAASVVRGKIPDNSLVVGNPARVIGRASLLRAFFLNSENTLDTLHLSAGEREAILRTHFGIRDTSNAMPGNRSDHDRSVRKPARKFQDGSSSYSRNR